VIGAATACRASDGALANPLDITPTSAIVQPEHSTRLTAWVARPDGTLDDVSLRVSWSSSDTGVATVDTVGDDSVIVIARGVGLASIEATLGSRRAYAPVAVSNNPGRATGALRRDSRFPRHFVDDSGRAVYLTGSHTWPNFQDADTVFPPAAFDYSAFLDTLQKHNHNFFRLWRGEQANWSTETTSPYWIAPTLYERVGPDTANDGQPGFDLTRFNPAYFERLRRRVAEAQQRGIFVSVMLFNGWSVEAKGRAVGNPWRGHPYHRDNNINGIDGDPNRDDAGVEVHRLDIPEIVQLEERYVRRVVDEINAFDNVLYEISNESTGGSAAWQHHMIELIHDYETRLGKRHPVGMTVERPGESQDALFSGPADWVSPWRQGPDPYQPPPSFGPKVIIDDTDHLCGVCGRVEWIWRSLASGGQPIVLDAYDPRALSAGALDNRIDTRQWSLLRRNLGYARTIASLIDLSAAEPLGALASTGYCLASPRGGAPEYLVAIPNGEQVWVNLEGAAGRALDVRWLEANTGRVYADEAVQGGAGRAFRAPFRGAGALYLKGQSAVRLAR
jgi:hypothetical protein